MDIKKCDSLLNNIQEDINCMNKDFVDIKKEQIRATLDCVRLIADCIRDAKRIPSGTLYAVMMSALSIEQYNRIISILVNAGLIEVKNHELFWIMKEGE